MLPTKFTRTREYTTRIGAFGGLNLTDSAAEGASYAHTVPNTELSAESNMTAKYYPALGIRGKRYNRNIGYDGTQQNPIVLSTVEPTYNGGLFFICQKGAAGASVGSYAYYKGNQIWDANDGLTTYLNALNHSFVNMGAYIIIMPEGVWFNTAVYGTSGATLSDYAGKIEIEKSKSDNDGILMYPCFDDGTVACSYPTGTLPISSSNFPTGGNENEFFPIYNGDKTEVNVYRWHNGSAVLNSDKIVKITSSVAGRNVGEGFFVGDCISLSDLQIKQQDTGEAVYDLNFGEYATVIACDKTSLTLRLGDVDNTSYVHYCQRLTHGANETAPFVGLYNFKIKRTMPKLDYITEWNNRLWGCGGDNHNTIYASALGNPCSWSLYENTAEDSYWANVDSGDAWTGAYTFNDHAYFFKNDKCYKMFGTRPANFSYGKLDFGTDYKKSICSNKSKMYFAKDDGVYVTNGTSASKISGKLGFEKYTGAVCWALDDILYYYRARMINNIPDRHLYSLDLIRGLWHEESTININAVCNIPDDVLVIDGEKAFVINGTSGEGYTAPVGGDGTISVGGWHFETQDFSIGTPNAKYIPRIQADLSLERGGKMKVKVMYDNNGIWRVVKSVIPCDRRTVLIPLLPKRCRSLKIRFEGDGTAKVYGLTFVTQGGSEYGNG